MSLLVTRPCYLALRRALHIGLCADAVGVVALVEPGRALGGDDIAGSHGPVYENTVPDPTAICGT